MIRSCCKIRACAQPSKRGKKKNGRKAKRPKKRGGKNADEGRDGQGFPRRITSLLEIGSSVPGTCFDVGLIGRAFGRMGLSLRFKPSNGRALPQQMVVVIAAASRETPAFSFGKAIGIPISVLFAAVHFSRFLFCPRDCCVSSFSLAEEIIVLSIN